jgi:hypothetical protein
MLLCLLLPVALLAQAESAGVPAGAPDVRVLIDVSGSMKRTDPHYLRRPALELLLQLMPAHAQAGVWTFGHEVRTLVPHGAATAAWRQSAQPKAALIGSSELLTDIPAALEAASAGLQPDAAGRTSIILLTDGMVDISKNPAENNIARRQLLERQLPQLRALGVKIHTVALSREADMALLERLAVDTGGLFAVAETAEELNRVFLRAFDAAAPAEQVPLKDNRFHIDDTIDELTALVLHTGGAPVELVAPDGRRFSASQRGDNVRWFIGKGYDLITVSDPVAGEWMIDTDLQSGSRVTIVSDLSLMAQRLPTNLFVGDETIVTASLMEQGQPMQRPELLKLVRFSATVLRRDDFRQWQVPLADGGDGQFRAALPMLAEAGTYEVSIDVDGKTFERSQRQELTVRDSFELQLQAGSEPGSQRVVLFARNPAVDGSASSVTATIVGPDGEQTQPVASGDGREWGVELRPAAQGSYRVSFAVEGRYAGGQAFTYRSAVVTVDAGGQSSVTGDAPPPQLVAETPEASSEAPVESEPANDEAVEEKTEKKEEAGWKRWVLYGGLVAGNLLLIGLGYLAFRMIMGGGKSEVLEAADDEGEAGTSPPPAKSDDKSDEKQQSGDMAKSPPPLDDLDLSLDAIDIDPGSDDKK